MKMIISIFVLSVVAIGLVSGGCITDIAKCSNLMSDVAKAGKDSSKICKAAKSFINCYDKKVDKCKKNFEKLEPSVKKVKNMHSKKCGSSAILSSVVVVFIGYFLNSLF
ncbi:Uncharacterised protein g11372 [Pycnogonum litorale]